MFANERPRSPSRGKENYHQETADPRLGCIALFAYVLSLRTRSVGEHIVVSVLRSSNGLVNQ